MTIRPFRGLVTATVAVLAFAAPAQAGTTLDNGVVRVGVADGLGGWINWLSTSASKANLLTAGDQLFSDGSTQEGGASTVQRRGSSIYVRSESGPFCGCRIETWISLDGNAVTVRTRLTRFGVGPVPQATAQELPRLLTTGAGQRLVTYDGDSPFRGQPFYTVVHDTGEPQDFALHPTESWVAMVDRNGHGFGLVEPGLTRFSGELHCGDREPGTFLSGARDEILDPNIVYEYRYALVVGTLREIRAYAYAHRVDPRPDYLFRNDREHFTEPVSTDAGFPFAGALHVPLDRASPLLVAPASSWSASRVRHVYVRGAWHSHQSTAVVQWWHLGTLGQRRFAVLPDGRFRTYRVDLFRSSAYRGSVANLRLQVAVAAEPGAWADISCISWKPCPVDRSAEADLSSTDRVVPFYDPFDELDPAAWTETGTLTASPQGTDHPTAEAIGGQLVVTIPTDVFNVDPHEGAPVRGVRSVCKLAGDYDVQVDVAAGTLGAVLSVGDARVYSSSFAVSFTAQLPEPFGGEFFPSPAVGLTSAVVGLRLVRSSGTVTAYYRAREPDPQFPRSKDSSWTRLASSTAASSPAGVSLYAFGHGTAAFDDYRLSRGQVKC